MGHHVATWTTAVILLLTLISGLEALRCICDTAKCNKDLTSCKYGTNIDPCHCCTVCSKGPGEECGGPWELRGKCGKGLMCKVDESNKGSQIGKCI